jgi:hypothetical protein
MPPDRKPPVTVFLSYASEDEGLANILKKAIERVFTFSVRTFMDQESIKLGMDFRTVIDTELDHADILIIIFTNQAKNSHSYTGYEVGYFSKSRELNPFITENVQRLIIPFCVGSSPPDTAAYMQGVNIMPEDVFSLFTDPKNLQETKDTTLNKNNPVLKLLSRIAEITMSVSDNPVPVDALHDIIHDPAQRLYKEIASYLKERVCCESFPERKIVIRAKTPLATVDEDDFVSTANVEILGRSFELFGIAESPSRKFKWQEFIDKINPPELATSWSEGIKGLVRAGLRGNYEGNYHMVSTLAGDRSFRMFVSRIVTYYSGHTDIDIYTVEIKKNYYCNELTTRLLKAISVGLKFRFLVLDKQSPFTPDNFKYATVQLKPRVIELVQQINMILRESHEARLNEPDILNMIFGKEGHETVNRNLIDWTRTSTELFTACDRIRTADNPEEPTERSAFIKILESFAEQTNTMNREFTTKAMEALAKEFNRITSTVCD